MSRSNFVVCRVAAIVAASALVAACGGGDHSSTELASAGRTDVTVHTPLVDDDGYPMPAVPAPADVARPATALGPATR